MRRVWLVWLSAGLVAAGIHAVRPPTDANDVYFDAIAVACTVAVGVRVGRPWWGRAAQLRRLFGGRAAWSGRLPRPSQSLVGPWHWIAASLALHALGDVMWTWLEQIQHIDPFPSVADVFYLSSYAVSFVGCGLLLRAARTDRADRDGLATIEATLVALALLMLSWRVVIGPTLHADVASHLAWAVGMSYPLADIGIAAVLTRLALEVSRRDASLRLLGASLLCLLVADSGFAVTTARGTYVNGQWSDSVNLLYYVFLTAAVLHPRATRTPAAAPQRPGGRNRLLLAGVCALTGPTTVLTAHPGDAEIMRVGAWGTLVLLALVVLRGNRHLVSLQSTAAALRHRARHDPLTELPNRERFTDLLSASLRPVEGANSRVAVLRVDLDGFRVVNDNAGHAAADALLLATAQRVRVLAPEWPVGRLGADEFGVIVSGDDAEVIVEALAEAVVAAMRRPFTVAGRATPMRASVGTAWVEAGEVDADDLLSRGDVALATAKVAGGGCAVAYDPDLAVDVLQAPALVAQLERALADGELEPVFQPLVALPSERITGFEALVRWRRNGRLIAPADFLPAAHGSGLIVDIDRLVLRESVRQLAYWRSGDRDARGLAMAVNVSVRSLEQPNIVSEILDVLQHFDVPAGLLTVEVTEESAAGDRAIRDRLDYLRRCGVRVALDDFGTGYSSLAYLEGFPADILKIAKPLVDPLTDPAAPTRVLGGVVQLAQACDFEVLAEGIETVEQRNRLVALGVRRGQGYLFARPTSADDAYAAWQLSVREGQRRCREPRVTTVVAATAAGDAARTSVR